MNDDVRSNTEVSKGADKPSRERSPPPVNDKNKKEHLNSEFKLDAKTLEIIKRNQ